MHHIVCSLSEASKIAFLDLELLMGMHGTSMEDAGPSSCTEFCNNFLWFEIVYDFWSYLEGEVVEEALNLISCTAFEFLFLLKVYSSLVIIWRDLHQTHEPDNLLTELVDGLALLIKICLCVQMDGPHKRALLEDKCLSWHYYHNCCW